MKRMTKASHAHHCVPHYQNITLNVITVLTIYFIRPIRDLGLCERLAFLFHHYFREVQKRRTVFCVFVRVSKVSFFLSIVQIEFSVIFRKIDWNCSFDCENKIHVGFMHFLYRTLNSE